MYLYMNPSLLVQEKLFNISRERERVTSLMASSCSSQSSSSWRMKVSLVFLGFLVMNSIFDSCMAFRPRRMMIVKEEDDDVDASLMALKYFRDKDKFPSDGFFHYTKLPKNVPIPPSGPSNRHNSSPQD